MCHEPTHIRGCNITFNPNSYYNEFMLLNLFISTQCETQTYTYIPNTLDEL